MTTLLIVSSTPAGLPVNVGPGGRASIKGAAARLRSGGRVPGGLGKLVQWPYMPVAQHQYEILERADE